MPKNKIKSDLKKKNIVIVENKKTKPSIDTEESDDETLLSRIHKKKEDIDEIENISENNEDEFGDDDTFGDDNAEIDDEDKEMSSDDEKNEDLENENDDKESKAGDEYDEKCIYNIADESDEEMDIVFDDDNEITHDINIVPPENRITKPWLTKYERVNILGVRSQQLTLGAKPMLESTDGLTPKEIAELELKHNVIPLIIERPLFKGKKEHWYIHELKH